MRLRSILAATALAGAIAIIPILADSAGPTMHAILDGTNLPLPQSAPFHPQRG